MFVPVTTKPYLNSVNFSVLQRVSLHFFLLIKKKLINILLPVYRIVQLTSFRVFLFLKTWITDPASLRFGDNSTNASNFTSFVFSESHLKEDFYYGKS